MSQFFVDNGGVAPGGDVISTSAQGGAAFPPSGSGNVDFSGAALGAITFAQIANGQVTATVRVDNTTIIINAANNLEAINQAITWEIITASQLGVRGHGYMVNSVSTITVTLPSTPALGDTITVVDRAGGTFIIQCDAISSIQLGDSTTLLAGSIHSQDVGDSVTLVSQGLITGAYPWIVVPAPSGNITIT